MHSPLRRWVPALLTALLAAFAAKSANAAQTFTSGASRLRPVIVRNVNVAGYKMADLSHRISGGYHRYFNAATTPVLQALGADLKSSTDPSGSFGRKTYDNAAREPPRVESQPIRSHWKPSPRPSELAPRRHAAPSSVDIQYIENTDKIRIWGRAAEHFIESLASAARLRARGYNRLDDTLDVMHKTYREVWAKLAVLDAVSKGRRVRSHNEHLDRTLTWIDGVMDTPKGTVAVHTHQVYSHDAPNNPQSEIDEGIRRVNRYLKEDVQGLFRPGGRAEAQVGERFRKVILGFDTGGHDEIKRHLRLKEAELRKQYGKRFEFVFVDELEDVNVPKGEGNLRGALNHLIEKHRKLDSGRIIEGVIYSRYRGVVHELHTLEMLLDQGYRILSSGREIFDPRGYYVTELDAVAEKNGQLFIVEAKSARVAIPAKYMLHSKIEYKLQTYRDHRELLERELGRPIAGVIFSVDIGPNHAWRKFLKQEQPRLTGTYKFPTQFLITELPAAQ